MPQNDLLHVTLEIPPIVRYGLRWVPLRMPTRGPTEALVHQAKVVQPGASMDLTLRRDGAWHIHGMGMDESAETCVLASIALEAAAAVKFTPLRRQVADGPWEPYHAWELVILPGETRRVPVAIGWAVYMHLEPIERAGLWWPLTTSAPATPA